MNPFLLTSVNHRVEDCRVKYYTIDLPESKQHTMFLLITSDVLMRYTILTQKVTTAHTHDSTLQKKIY
jgi:hypothetical protein